MGVCPVHCPKPSAGPGLFMAAVVLFLAVGAAWAVSALSGALAAVTVTILAVDAVAAAVTWRMIRYGRRMHPVRRPAARLVRAPYQLPAQPLAIEAAPVVAAVVPGAGEKVESWAGQ